MMRIICIIRNLVCKSQIPKHEGWQISSLQMKEGWEWISSEVRTSYPPEKDYLFTSDVNIRTSRYLKRIAENQLLQITEASGCSLKSIGCFLTSVVKDSQLRSTHDFRCCWLFHIQFPTTLSHANCSVTSNVISFQPTSTLDLRYCL